MKKAKEQVRIIVHNIGLILALTFIARLVYINMQSLPTNTFLTILSIVGVLIDLAAFIDSFISKTSYIKRFIGKVSYIISAKISDRKTKKYQKIFPSLSINDPE